MLIFFNVVGDNIFAERYLFGSSIALAFLFSSFISYLWEAKSRKRRVRRKKGINVRFMKGVRITLPVLMVRGVVNGAQLFARERKKAAVAVTLVVVASSLFLVLPRNQEWKDNMIFLRTTLEQNPNAHSIRKHLADEFRLAGDWEAAKVEYETIVARNPDFRNIASVYNGLAEYFRYKEEASAVEGYYEKAIEASGGTNYHSYNNLGAHYVEQGKTLRALVNFCQALQVRPDAPEPQQNFGQIAGMISAVEDDTFIFLYQDVIFGGAFTQAVGDTIQFKDSSCAYGRCVYTFIPDIEDDKEALFPFLIMAQAFPQEVIRVEKTEFSRDANEILITIDPNYQDRLITFYFPTCTGKNYVVEVSSPVFN